MIACTSTLSLHRLYSLVKIATLPKIPIPTNQFQLQCSYHGLCYNWIMGGAKDSFKRRKRVELVWRAVSTQASSYEEHVVKEVLEGDNGSQIQEVQESSVNEASVSAGANGELANSVEKLSQIQEVQESSLSEASVSAVADGELTNSVEKRSISIEVGSSLLRFIKGKGGSTQKKIEEELGVNILFPSSKKEDHITIEGSSSDSVSKAAEKIQTIIDEVVQSQSLDYSHFISLPLAIHPELVDKLLDFQNCILENSNSGGNEIPESDSSEDELAGEDDDQQVDDVAVKLKVNRDESAGEDNDQQVSDVAVKLKVSGDESAGEDNDQQVSEVAVKLQVEDNSEKVKVDITSIPIVSYPPKASQASVLSDSRIEKSIFIKPKTFHLTVLMLKLWNKERVSLASELLQSISSKVIDALDNRPIHVRLKGLDCMRGSLAKAKVLYAPIEEIGGDGRLLRACQVIIDAYKEAGLVLEKDAKQKLKLHATLMNARHRKRKIRKKFDSFDAREIFKKYKSEHWGDYHLREAHLSQRFVFDENGYYHCCASISLPDSMQLE